MNREQKELVVESLRQDFLGNKASFLVEVQGLSVAQLESLRGSLRHQGGKLKIAKARLMRLALQSNDNQGFQDYLKNQIGVVFAQEQVSPVAKILYDFSREHESLKLLVGSFENNILAKQDIINIASLPSKEVLLAQVCGTLQAPMLQFVRVLNGIILQFLFVLKQIEEKK